MNFYPKDILVMTFGFFHLDPQYDIQKFHSIYVFVLASVVTKEIFVQD